MAATTRSGLELVRHEPRARRSGPPLLMLPGAFHGAWCFVEHWSPYFAARGHDVYAMSYRGHGASEGSYEGASIADYLTDVKEVLAVLPEKPVLIGHSMGGFLAQHLVAEEAFPAAVLVATVPHVGMPIQALACSSARHPWRLLRALATRDMRPFFDSPDMLREGLFSDEISEETLAKHFDRCQGESLRAFAELGPLGRRPPPGPYATPTLTLAGSEDWTQTPARLRRTAAAVGGDYQTVEGSGHDIMLDVRWREAAGAIEAWLVERRLFNVASGADE